jgi:hypothetical protein
MASRLVNTACIGLALAFSSSIQAQDNNIEKNAASETMQVSEEVIVVEQKAQTTEKLQIAVAPTSADAHSLVLENLSKRLGSSVRVASNNQLDI